jgi:drug/metabolite transporter (DMT)-like permease
MAFSFIVLLPFAMQYSWNMHTKTLKKQWKGILYIGGCMALNIAMNNMSLVSITLSLNQVIRSSLPVIACIIALIIEKKALSLHEILSISILSVGVMIAVWQGRVDGKFHGVVFCALGTICSATTTIFSCKLLSEKLDVVRLTFYTAPISLVCLLPFVVRKEWVSFQAYYTVNPNGALYILLGSSILALVYNLVHVLVIKKVSGVTTTVIGEVKIVALLILSALLLDEAKYYNPQMLIGCTLAVIGFIAYSHTKLMTSKYYALPQIEDKGHVDEGWTPGHSPTLKARLRTTSTEESSSSEESEV